VPNKKPSINLKKQEYLRLKITKDRAAKTWKKNPQVARRAIERDDSGAV
jgi:hypothetical protein